jgi:hypothetical protein
MRVDWAEYGPLSFGREDAFVDQCLSLIDAVIEIDPQRRNRCSTNRRSASKDWTAPEEMRMPNIATWIEQQRHLFRLSINARDVWAFEGIAGKASQAEINGNGRSAVADGDDVIDLEWQNVVRP